MPCQRFLEAFAQATEDLAAEPGRAWPCPTDGLRQQFFKPARYTKRTPMSFEIRQSEREGIVVLELKGRLAVGEASTVREKVNELAAAAHYNVIFNLEHVDYIDSTGLGSMVICFTTLKKAGGALKLVNLNKRNIELLLLTKLHTIIEVFSDEQDAVNSYFPGRTIKRFDILSFVQDHQSDE
jgi:anti-sigma B factor antagonist